MTYQNSKSKFSNCNNDIISTHAVADNAINPGLCALLYIPQEFVYTIDRQ